MKRFAFDTEFMWDGRRINLISIGIEALDSTSKRQYSAQFVEADYNKANQWVKENVISHLFECPTGKTKAQHKSSCNHYNCPWRNKLEVRREILNFFGIEKFELWAYYCHWDFVALMGLYGDMSKSPDNWPMMCYDLRQLLDFTGHSDVRQSDSDVHNALFDAGWVAKTLVEYDPRHPGVPHPNVEEMNRLLRGEK